MLLSDWLQMLLHDDVVNVQNDEAPGNKKNKKNKNPLYLFCTSVRGNPVYTSKVDSCSNTTLDLQNIIVCRDEV